MTTESSSPAVPEGIVTGNVYDKYRTANPLYRKLMQGFLASCRELLDGARIERVLEVGCGPGDLVGELLPALSREPAYVGLDLGLDEVATARRVNPPARHFLGASAYTLPFADASFDGVWACEVFEHLDDPETALDEIARVGSRYLLLSVPWEPVWRILNVARGKYLRELGNTPGHVQHYSRGAVRRLVSKRFRILGERRPLPWTVLFAELR